MKKNVVPWIFAVIVLTGLLILSVILGMSGYYFSISYMYSNSDLVVGNNLSIGVEPNQSNVASFTFDGAYFPNEKVPQVVQINASDLNTDVAVRVKARVFGESDADIGFVTTEHFEEAEDGYFYYDGVLKGGNKITFCTYVVMPSSLNFVKNEKYILTFVVETLDSNLEVDSIWKKVLQ